jgi:hypothetical protein
MTRRAWVLILGAALVVGVALSPLSSSLPDGLNTAAARLGFAHHAAPLVSAPLAHRPPAFAAVAGSIAVFLLSSGAAWLLRRRSDTPAAPRES